MSETKGQWQTDAEELARLLLVIPDAIEHYRALAGTKGANLARAVELLIDALARARWDLAKTRLERDSARARVAELEARLARGGEEHGK